MSTSNNYNKYTITRTNLEKYVTYGVHFYYHSESFHIESEIMDLAVNSLDCF